MAEFPSQILDETKKDHKWGQCCVEYGLSLLDRPDSKIERLYNSYNGVRTTEDLKWITLAQGKETRAKFIPYKVGRSKQYLLEGEWLRRPLNATVSTINIQAKSEKLEQQNLMYGAMLAKEELDSLKQSGLDVMEGAPVPKDEDDPIWQKMSPKDKQEDIMQVILNEQVKSLNLPQKCSNLFTDARIAAMCWAKIEINEKGDVDVIRFHPSNAIFEEIEGDDFCERSVIKGGRRWIPLHEALLRYTLSDTDGKLLEDSKTNSNYKYSYVNGVCMVEEVHVEWKSVRPVYYKIMPKTENQLAYDPESKTITKVIPAEIYEKNKAKYDKGVAKGEFEIQIKYEEDLWEGTSLARVVFTNIRRKQFQLRSFDDPAKILDSSYIGCLFGTVNGVRVSLQELIENFDLQYDICEFKILQELIRAKGRAIGFDLAALPKNKTLAKLIQELTDDQFITYNSQAAGANGNVAGRNLELQKMIQEVDLGFSSTFPYLLQLQNQIVNELNRITGINEFREGSGPASATLGSAQQGLQNSRTITEPLFYMMELFQQKLMHRVVEATKISWAFYKLDKGEQILGTEKYQYMKVTRELGYRDYGVHIENGLKYARLREKMDTWMEYALNSKQVTMLDAAKYELAESTVEAINIFEQSRDRLEQLTSQSQQQQLQAQQAMQQQQLQTQIQIAQEDREDRQSSELDLVNAKAQAQIEVDNNEMRGKLVENQHKAENDLLAGI